MQEIAQAVFDTPGFVCFHRIEAQGTSMFQDLLFGRRRPGVPFEGITFGTALPPALVEYRLRLSTPRWRPRERERFFAVFVLAMAISYKTLGST